MDHTRKMSSDFGISEDLAQFLETWADVDIKPEEAAEMLHGKSGEFYHAWLQKGLLAVAQAGKLTPVSLGALTNRHFEDQNGVTAWLQRVWPLWFDVPYPGADKILES